MDYERLNNIKDELLHMEQVIKQNMNRLSLVKRNLKDKNKKSDILTFLDLAYKITSEELESLKAEYFDLITPTNSEKLNKEIMSSIASSICNRFCSNKEVFRTVNKTIEYVDQPHYLILKTLIKQSKKPLIDIPNKIISEDLNCKIYTPECGDPIDPKLMFKTFEVESFVVDDLKTISYPKDLGQFVAMCDEPAIIDKSTDEVIQQAMVSYFTVKLSDKLAKFQFVK